MNSICIRKWEMLFNDFMSENHEFFPEVIFGLHEEHVITCILNKSTGQLYWMSQSEDLHKLHCTISIFSIVKCRL